MSWDARSQGTSRVPCAIWLDPAGAARREIAAEFVMAFAMEAFDGCLFDGSVHSLDLVVGPGMFDLYPAMFDADARFANWTPLSVTEVGQGGDKVLRSRAVAIFRLWDEAQYKRTLKFYRWQRRGRACPWRFRYGSSHLNFFFAGLPASTLGRREIPWRCRQHAREVRQIANMDHDNEER